MKRQSRNIRRLLNSTEKNFTAFEGRAEAFRRTGKTAAAEADRQKATKLFEKDVATNPLRSVLVEQITYDEPIIVEQALNDSYIEFYLETGEEYFLGSADEKVFYEENITKLTKALKANPLYTDGFFERGNNYLELDKFDQAIADYSQAIKLDPNDYRSFNNRGIACAKTGNFERAIADFARASSINPKQHSSLYNFGLVLINNGLFEQSIGTLTTYIKKNPNDINSYRLRAEAYRKLGKIAEAEADEEVAKRLEKENLNR